MSRIMNRFTRIACPVTSATSPACTDGSVTKVHSMPSVRPVCCRRIAAAADAACSAVVINGLE